MPLRRLCQSSSEQTDETSEFRGFTRHAAAVFSDYLIVDDHSTRLAAETPQHRLSRLFDDYVMVFLRTDREFEALRGADGEHAPARSGIFAVDGDVHLAKPMIEM